MHWALAVVALTLLAFAAISGRIAGTPIGLWLAVSLALPRSIARWRDLVPGALLYGVGILGVQAFTVYLFGRLLESKASTYGTLGASAAILFALF